ncbi:MAG: hypothetical protein ACKVT1_07795 [Dehalococcoidia bacterium]
MHVFPSPRRRRGGSIFWIIFAVVIVAIVLGSSLIGALSVCAATGSDPADSLLGLVGLDDGVDTREAPGDARAFDPLAALPEIAAYAGEGARLISVEIALVRADGTLDLKASYTPKPQVTYTFAREIPRPADAPPPGAGGANTGPWHEPVEVRVYEPGQRRRRTTTSGGVRRTVDYVNKGMERDVGEASAAAVAFVETPACRIAEFWKAAIAQGAPADGVARITYDADGYDFAVTGFRVSLRFGADCALKPK